MTLLLFIFTLFIPSLIFWLSVSKVLDTHRSDGDAYKHMLAIRDAIFRYKDEHSSQAD